MTHPRPALLRALLSAALLTAAAPSYGRADEGDPSDAGLSTGPADLPGPATYTLFDPAPLEGTIATGRPSFGTGTQAVPAGRFQLETGYTYSAQGDDGTQTYPTPLLRVGLVDRVEFRLSTAGYVQADAGEDGLTGPRVGFKFEVFDERGLRPALAIQPSVLLPLGEVPGGHTYDPLLQIAAAHSLPGPFAVAANVSVGASTASTAGGGIGSGAAQATTAQAAAYAHSEQLSYFPTGRVGLFVEHFATYTDAGDGDDQQNLDVGATYLLNDNNQVDVVLGVGLNEAAPDYFVGAGYSFRF